MQLNGLNISKHRKNSQFVVKLIDSSQLPTSIITNEIAVGDIVTHINNIDLNEYTTETAAQLLSTVMLFSIVK